MSQIAIKRSFSPAQTVLRQGEEPDAIYFVVKGHVDMFRIPVTKISPSEKHFKLHADTALSESQHIAAIQLFSMM
jgi:hypothetical protein